MTGAEAEVSLLMWTRVLCVQQKADEPVSQNVPSLKHVFIFIFTANVKFEFEQTCGGLIKVNYGKGVQYVSSMNKDLKENLCENLRCGSEKIKEDKRSVPMVRLYIPLLHVAVFLDMYVLSVWDRIMETVLI